MKTNTQTKPAPKLKRGDWNKKKTNAVLGYAPFRPRDVGHTRADGEGRTNHEDEMVIALILSLAIIVWIIRTK